MRTRHDTGHDLTALSGLLQELTEDMPAGREQQLRDRLLAGIRQAQPPRAPLPRQSSLTRPGPAGQPGRGRARVIAGAMAATAALVTAATVIGITAQGGHARPRAGGGAIELLAKAAAAAARLPAPQVRHSQYMYVKTVVAYPSPAPPATGPYPRQVHLARLTSQTWVPVADVCRTGLERTITATGRVSSATFSARGSTKCPSIGGLDDATYRLLQTLPTSPHALLALIYRVERGHGPSPDEEAFVTIGDLLDGKIPPPRVAAALYRAAALIPGVTVIHRATDAIGRPGVAVARTGPGADGGVRQELIFSRTTLRLIGERTVIASRGEVTGATAIIARGFVRHRGQVPPATSDGAS